MTEFTIQTIGGACECGCGLPTKVSPRTNVQRGYVEGQPRRFAEGHARRRPNYRHYRRVKSGDQLVRIHRVRAEKALGKPLPPNAVVHHADGSIGDTAPLVICQDNTYHKLLHVRMRVRAAGGDPNTDAICSKCRLPKPLSEFTKNRTTRNGRHHACRDCRRDTDLLRYRVLKASSAPRAKGRPLKTACVRGHLFSSENTIRRKDGGRECRQCQQDRNDRRPRAIDARWGPSHARRRHAQ